MTLFHATSPFVSASIPFISATILHSSSLLLHSSPPTIPSSTRFYSIRLHYCSVISVPLFRRLLPTILLSPPLYIFHRILPIVRRFCLYYNFLRHYSVVSSFPPFGLLFRLLHMFKGAGTSAAFLLVPP